MENSHITWTHHTFNPWEGCDKVSPGCVNCYAEARAHRFSTVVWGKGQPRRRTSPSNWRNPILWDRKAEANKSRDRVFCASLADWLDDEVDPQWLADLLDLIQATQHLDWLLLTKRIEDWRDRLNQALPLTALATQNTLSKWLAGEPPINVWLGTTTENQEMADRRVPILLDIPAKIRFLSVEPQLEKISISRFADSQLHWVICGGESGSNARPFDLVWARSLRQEAAIAGINFFFKQTGQRVLIDGNPLPVVGKGDVMSEFPADLQVQEFPS